MTKLRKHRYQHPYALTVGIFVLIFALVGVAFSIYYSIRLTGYILDNTRQKNEFEYYLLPVVMLDPPTFESVNNLDELFLLQSSMWYAILNNDTSTYVKDDNGYLLLPVSDVDLSAVALYGPTVKLKHQTFGDYVETYEYDEELNVYRVPQTAQSSMYTPRVDSIQVKGDRYYLSVGYIPQGNLWTQNKNGTVREPDPIKTMEYCLVKEDGSYYIESMRDPLEGQNSSRPAIS